MELLVALALFAMTSALIADLFLTASRQQVRSRVWSRIQGDARLVLETISRELRDGMIDYRDPQAGVLAIRDVDGRAVRFQRSVSDCAPKSPSCVRIGRESADGSMVWASLTSAETNTEAFDVAVDPAVDPYAWDPKRGAYAADAPPRVTVYLQITATTGRPIDRPSIEAQTTVVSRMYRR